jgi:hypothetical protein
MTLLLLAIIGELGVLAHPHGELAHPGTAALQSEVGLGADYSNQRYSAITLDTMERDTASIETEGRSFWRLTFDRESGRTRFEAVNLLNLTTRSLQDQLSLDLEQELTRKLNLRAEYQTEARYYHNALPLLGDTSYRRDYWNNDAGLTIKFDPIEQLELSLSGDLEYQDYLRDTTASDYLLNRSRLAGVWELGELATLDASYGRSQRWDVAPDSQDYVDHDGQIELDSYLGTDWQLTLSNDLNRRVYSARERSYWEEAPSVALSHDFSSSWGTSLSDEARLTRYDSATPLYTNQLQNTSRLAIEIRPSLDLTIRFGPQWEFNRGPTKANPEDYREGSIVAGLDYLKAGGVSISLEDRLGSRRYPFADSNYQSDYRFNELNLTLDWPLLATTGGSLGLSGLASITPEWHTDRTDNLAVSNYSLELNYRF